MVDSPKYPTDLPTSPHPRASKDDHKGTTAAGLYYLAEDFLRAAKLTAANARSLTEGPPRLLALHACELFLKAYLLHAGRDLDALRTHNLERLHEQAASEGMTVSASTVMVCCKPRNWPNKIAPAMSSSNAEENSRRNELSR